jgi:hypothetical protein
VRPQFTFHPHRHPAALGELLAGARLVVVPSRWENFPYTCIEAMASGVPVVVSPTGGMAEMVEDARTGWVAASQAPEHLADAVTEALDRSPTALAEAGAAAAQAIARLTDPDVIVTAHRDLADRLVRTGATRSLAPPDLAAGPGATGSLTLVGDLPAVACAIVVGHGRDAREVTRRSLRTQQAALLAPATAHDTVEDQGAAINRWLREIGVMASPAALLAVTWLPAGTWLAPDALHRAMMVLRRHARVGVVSGWIRVDDLRGRLVARPDPSLPHQWLRNDVVPIAVYRAEAVRRQGGVREELSGPALAWDLANALMVDGWGALTLPDLLGTVPAAVVQRWERASRDGTIRARLMDRFPAEVTAHAIQLAELRALEERHGAIDAPSRLARIGRTLRRGARRPVRATSVLARGVAHHLRGPVP